MIERAGTAVCLSVAIVIAAVIVLHRPGVPRAVDDLHPPPSKPAPKPRLDRPTVTARSDPPKGILVKAVPGTSHLPDSALTQVREGETLDDVARRVYGESANLDGFWRVNRDQVATRNSEVRAGMVLRTPPL